MYALTGGFTIRCAPPRASRFTGAAGSGTVSAVVTFSTLEVAYVWEGLVALPKK